MITVATSLVDDSVGQCTSVPEWWLGGIDRRTRGVALVYLSFYPSSDSGESIDVPERWLGGALIQYCAGMAAKGSFQWIERVVKAGALAQRLKVYALTDCNCRRRTQKEQKAEIMELWLELLCKELELLCKEQRQQAERWLGPVAPITRVMTRVGESSYPSGDSGIVRQASLEKGRWLALFLSRAVARVVVGTPTPAPTSKLRVDRSIRDSVCQRVESVPPLLSWEWILYSSSTS